MVIGTSGPWDQLCGSGQRARSQEAKHRFVGLVEALFSTPWVE